jgi:DNA repair exonuclease SbcCD ATPase subunit
VKLLKLHAHNVFSIGTIDLDLKDRGLVLVTGWSNDENNGNMAGKSSVANRAIVWGLYGRTVDGIKADDVINTSIKNAKHCGVRIHVEGIDGNTYRIYRQRKPNELVLSILNPGALEDEEEWQDLSKRNEKDTQELINALLGRDHKTFIQSDFFGQGRERSFLALPGSDQKAVIEEILPLNSLEEWKEKAKASLHLLEGEVDVAEESQRIAHELETMAIAHLHTLQSQEAGWATNNSVALSNVQQQLNASNALTETIEDEITALKRGLPEGKVAMLQKEHNILCGELVSELGTMNYRVDALTGDIDRRAARPDICASCEQQLPDERVKVNLEKLEEDKVERVRLIKEREGKEAKLSAANAVIAICMEVQEIEKKWATKDQKQVLEEKLKLFKEGVNPFLNMVNTAQLAVKHEKYKGEQARLRSVELVEERDHYKFWVNAYGTDLKTLIFNQVCPYLERQANKYLRELDNGQIKVKFRTVKMLKSGDARDQFCVTAASDTGGTVFGLFSGAEKQLTSFAVGMALSDLAGMQTEGASSFMILDEPFLYQSPENCERIISFITQKMSGKTILIISNEDNLVSLLHDRIHIVKEKGVSYIE